MLDTILGYVQIIIADLILSGQNGLAAAEIAKGDAHMPILGLGPAIVLIAFAATLVLKLLAKYPWVSLGWLDCIDPCRRGNDVSGFLRYVNGRWINAWFGGRHGHV